MNPTLTYPQKRAIVRLKRRWHRWPDALKPLLCGHGAVVATYYYQPPGGTALHHAIETDGYCHT